MFLTPLTKMKSETLTWTKTINLTNELSLSFLLLFESFKTKPPIESFIFILRDVLVPLDHGCTMSPGVINRGTDRRWASKKYRHPSFLPASCPIPSMLCFFVCVRLTVPYSVYFHPITPTVRYVHVGRIFNHFRLTGTKKTTQEIEQQFLLYYLYATVTGTKT